jgi:hypothetical protein
VRRHPGELLEALVLLGDRLGVERHERFDRRLREHVHRLIESGNERDAVGRVRRLGQKRHLLGDERDEHAVQHLILAEDLVERSTLTVPQRPQLPCLLHD